MSKHEERPIKVAKYRAAYEQTFVPETELVNQGMSTKFNIHIIYTHICMYNTYMYNKRLLLSRVWEEYVHGYEVTLLCSASLN